MKTLVKTALFTAYKYSGVPRLLEYCARRAGRSFLTVLVFHRVTDEIPEDGLTVCTRRFRAICRMLRRGFHVVPVAEIVRLLHAGTPLPPRTVAITFDDCYRDNLGAARVLTEQGLPACFFIPTAFVDTDTVFPWDRALKRMPNLSWDDVRSLAALGHEIGSHTVTHTNLGETTAAQTRRELVESKRTLEAQLQRPVRWFAYPFGGPENVQPEQLGLVAEAGYEACFSAHGGVVRAGHSSLLLPRTPVPYLGSALNLELHLTGCLDWFYALNRRAGWVKELPRAETNFPTPLAERETRQLSPG